MKTVKAKEFIYALIDANTKRNALATRDFTYVTSKTVMSYLDIGETRAKTLLGELRNEGFIHWEGRTYVTTTKTPNGWGEHLNVVRQNATQRLKASQEMMKRLDGF